MISPRIFHIFVCCQALAEGLKHNSALANLILHNNNIGATGAQAWCLGEDAEESVKRGRGTAVGIETEPIECEIVNWAKGRLHRELVLRCAKSIMQI